MRSLFLAIFFTLLTLASSDAVTESSDIRQSSAQAVAPTQNHVATSPHPFSRQIAAPSRVVRRSITPVPIVIRARRV